MSDIEADVSQLAASEWGGGVLPYAGSKKFGMWLFIVSDAITFSVLLVGYAYVRVASQNWPQPFEFFPSIVTATVMTLCLLSSSLTMVMAVNASRRGNRARTVRWLLATIAGGLAFLVLHGNEWNKLIHEGMTLFSNPWGAPLFGATFFALTGMHMFHVFTGVGYLGVVAFATGRGKFNAEDVEVSGLYWHFVDLVWMFIFPLVYILSIHRG
ncbi:MAG: cytochrome c oxidase subunit 3 [Acidobacteriia bacterium]|nr:cytochrome c oxidase subunit 3 [Terriglobia bacterium]